MLSNETINSMTRTRTDVMCLVKDNDRIFRQLLRDQVGNLGVEHVMVRVDNDICVCKLKLKNNNTIVSKNDHPRSTSCG